MNVDGRHGHKQVNLLQDRRVDGRWQSIRAVRKNGKLDPRLVLIEAEPTAAREGISYRQALAGLAFQVSTSIRLDNEYLLPLNAVSTLQRVGVSSPAPSAGLAEDSAR
jgi:hypothetical protein